MKKYPSVTTVLGLYSDFSMINPTVLETASLRGTEVHNICLMGIAKGNWVPEIPSDCAGYVLSFQNWFEQNVKEVLLVEEELIDNVHGFMGHPDLVVVLRDDSRLLADLKTPISKIKIWSAQLAAYKYLAKEGRLADGTTAGFSVDRVGSLRLRPNGSPPIFDEYTDSALDFVAFLSALSAFRYFTGK